MLALASQLISPLAMEMVNSGHIIEVALIEYVYELYIREEKEKDQKWVFELNI